MTCSIFFSLFLAVSMRQVDIASKAAFTAWRVSSESPGTDIGLKLRGVSLANLFCMARTPLTDQGTPSGPHKVYPALLLRVSHPPTSPMTMQCSRCGGTDER